MADPLCHGGLVTTLLQRPLNKTDVKKDWRIRQSPRGFERQRDSPYGSDGDICCWPTIIGLRSGTCGLIHWVSAHHRDELHLFLFIKGA